MCEKKNTSSAASATSAITTTIAPPPENMLKATPVLRVWMNLIPRIRSTSSKRAICPRTIALVI